MSTAGVRDESGQSLIEFAGLIVLVALCIGALAATAIPSLVAAKVQCAVRTTLSGAPQATGCSGGAETTHPAPIRAAAGRPAQTMNVSPPGAGATARPGSLPPGFKPQGSFGHCGPDQVPLAIERHLDYLPPVVPGGVYVGDLCAWHDRCNAWVAYLKDGYNCNTLLAKALHTRCDQAPKAKRAACNWWADRYVWAVEATGSSKDTGPPPPQVGYPPGS